MLTEYKLNRIIMESVKKVLNEDRRGCDVVTFYIFPFEYPVEVCVTVCYTLDGLKTQDYKVLTEIGEEEKDEVIDWIERNKYAFDMKAIREYIMDRE